MEEAPLSSLLGNFFNPKPLASFHVPTLNPVVYLQSKSGEAEAIELDELYPFMTIQDIKTYIYIQKGKAREFHPSFQALLIPMDAEPSEKQTETYIPLDFAFVNMDKKGKILVTHTLRNPFTRAQPDSPVDDSFVTASGKKKILKISNRSNSTMEDVFLEVFATKRPVIHLFLYSDVISGLDEAFLKTEREWNGRIYPSFPLLTPDYEEVLEEKEEKLYLDACVTNVTNTIDMMNNLNDLIDTTGGMSRSVPLTPIKMVSVKFLRLVWKKPFQLEDDVETLFYKIPTTYTIPFLRILPSEGMPITKIFVESPLRIPSFDPRLIKQWADEKGPSKDDFLFGKVMIRNKEGAEPALFGTLRIFDDRSADFILQPPKNLKKLMMRDILEFPTFLENAINDSYLQDPAIHVDIGEAAVICGIPIGLKTVSKQQFLQRVKAFAPLFQEIPPLPNENPIVMLRYRAVSKFSAEDKVFTFLTQYSSRKVANGQVDPGTYVSDMIRAIMETFQMRFTEANNLFVKWSDEKNKLTLNVAESKDFILQYNRGIDIAVFAQQSAYSFHLYRVDSTIHLQRILTALSLLLSGDDDNFNVKSEEVQEIEDAHSIIDTKTQEEGDQNFDDDLDDAFLDVIGEDVVGEEVGEAEEAAFAAAQEVKVVQQTAPKTKVAENVSTEAKEKTLREYFTKRLYDIDPELFPLTEGPVRKGKEPVKSKGKGDKKQAYSIKCQSTNDRQPVGLTEEQYEAMLDEYKEDDVSFLEFPLREGEQPKLTDTVIYVLKYGSSSLKLNYYICCEYFCIKDYMMLLEKDFEGDQFRPPKIDKEGNKILKQKNTCPFCEGKVIVNKRNPGPNEWVFKRKEDNNKYIKLMSHTSHPQGLFQPCCFGTFPEYTVNDPQFAHLQYRPSTEEEKEGEEDDEQKTAVTATAGKVVPINYQLTIFRAHKKYIVEKNRIPLEVGDIGGPQIGLLPQVLDPYFLQDDDVIIHTPQQKQELKPESLAFLRVGVDNRPLNRNESLFSAVAPFLNANTAEDVRRRILERIDPRNFLYLNYGNLLLEFYNPSDAKPQETELRLWSQKNLQTELSYENKDAILRLWKSYYRFLDFLHDKQQLKEYRQFAQMFALPGFLTERGVIFIILDIVKDGDVEKLEVRCPPYGYDNEQFLDADIGFLMHHHTGIWEPIFVSENKQMYRQFGESHNAYFKFQRAAFAAWPSIIQKRVLEFTQKCAGPGRAAWTSGSLVDSFAMIPLSRAIQGIAPSPEGIIRDAYNHIVALTYRAEAGKPRLVALPVVDDGTIVTPLRLHFDWDDYPAATADNVIEFYKEYVEPIFSYYLGYAYQAVVKDESTRKIVAVRLDNGIYIPCIPPKAESDPKVQELIGKNHQDIQVMEWAINRDIIFGSKTNPIEEEPLETEEEKINEAFEYLRLTFSKWFSSESVSGQLRLDVEKILNLNLPLFEKRKRLDILLGPTILEWMQTEGEFKDEQKSLLRVDCRLQPSNKCSGQCIWKESDSTCRIHVPDGENYVNVPVMLQKKLFEELLRFPERRKQLLEKQVSPLVTLKQAVQIQDQYIVPESTMAWYDLLHADVLGITQEKKKFFEEMSSDAPAPIAVPSKEAAEIGKLPDDLINLLYGDEEPTEQLYLYRPQGKEAPLSVLPFLVSLGTFPSEIGLEDDALALTPESMRKLVLLARRPIIQINLMAGKLDQDAFGPAKRMKDPTPFILIAQDLEDGGPAMLSLSPEKPVPVPISSLPLPLEFLYEDRTPVKD